ncbi:uncharacterized protein PHACADRAFT_258490 [Phanerochaete carnosa HHB-10118-sp]|uniref:Uncharacterized protein n=1 Tax=Phanerochaete carnosa (strain HHB-10118-sp) TaxID=650164 RepID=K5WVS4_PHACS|nr:uncharacterized protein PHACADRAFT_258490 [Phanerochaete carnosa HHB-10118-sp]EKM54557.1 hypothetical protein PHACADRAFT_258490 [Phanerochaete carnosa HHB-10118-sp]
MSSAKGIVLAEDAPLPEKKRKFSFFRGRNTEPIVTVIPVEGPSSPQTPTPLTSPTHTQASGSGWQAGSVRSSSSFLGDISSAQRAPSLSQALEDPDLLSKADVDGLPTYASVGYPPVAVTYSFVRCSPFAMMLCPEGSSTEGSGLYHISVGVNVWMPSMTVTTVRRGSGETGPIIASLE